MKLTILVLVMSLPTVLTGWSQRQGGLFADPEFAKRFMGSYGFLPEVEPPLDLEDEEERAYFAEIKGMLEADDLGGLKGKLMRDMDVELSHPALLFMLGNIWFQEGNHSEAQRWYEAAIRRFPSYLRAYKNLGLLHYQRGDHASAVRALSEAVRLGDGSPQTMGLLGICHGNGGSWLAAESALRQAVVLEPTKPEWQTALLRVFFDSGQQPAALSLVNQLLAVKPEDQKLWLMKGRALMEMERPAEAALAFEVLRHLGGAGPEVLEILGAIYMDQEQADAALAAYTAAAKASAKLKGSSVLRIANLLFGYAYVDQAKRYVSQLGPRTGELTGEERLALRTLEAKIARAEGDRSGAMRLLEALLLEDHANGEARMELGQLYAQEAKEAPEEETAAAHYARAKMYFEQALQMGNVEAEAALRYGQMLVSKGDYQAAVPLLQRAQELNPKEALDQYLKRVERAARRQEAKEESLRQAASGARERE